MKRRLVTLYYDADNGALLDPDLTDQFLAESALLRADVLQDALRVVGEWYVDAAGDIFPEAKGE